MRDLQAHRVVQGDERIRTAVPVQWTDPAVTDRPARCRVPGCELDALPTHGVCARHERFPAIANAADSDLRRWFADQDEEEEMEDGCKIAGCDRTRVDKAGIYANLCAVHKQEKKAARAADPSVDAPATNGRHTGTLDDLTQAVLAARLELDRALDHLTIEINRMRTRP